MILSALQERTARYITVNNNGSVVAGQGGNGGIVLSPMNEYIGMTMQEHYNYVNNTAFYNMVSPQMRPFYRKVQNWEQWINGFVPSFHTVERGVMPTHFAKAVVDKVSALIYGGGIMFEASGKEQDNQSETLDFISMWAKKTDFKQVIQEALRYSAGLGTSAIKLNFSLGRPVWCEAVPLNRSLYTLSGNGEIIDCRFYIKSYTNTKTGENYSLCEERFYQCNEKGKRVPFGVYRIYRENVAVNQFTAPSVYTEWRTLPQWVRKAFKEDYGGVLLDEAVQLPFRTIGVYRFLWTASLNAFSGLKYGDSVLEGIIRYLCEYDVLESILDTEMYSGKSRVLATKAVTSKNRHSLGVYNDGLDNMITYVEAMSTDGEPIKFIQPNMRAEEIRSIRNTLLENIATAIGISPSSFASYLQDGSNRTAREISAEESATTLYVENKREIILNTINDLLHDITDYYGKTDDVMARFSKAGQTNYNLLVENTIRLYQSGLMDLEQALSAVNPQLDTAQIKKIAYNISVEQNGQ